MAKNEREARITGISIRKKLSEALDLDKGLLYTVWALTVKPAESIGSYVDGERRLVNPFKYVTYVVAASLVMVWAEVRYNPNVIAIDRNEIGDEIMPYLFQLITVVVCSFLVYLIHLKKGFNFYEVLVLNLFMVAHAFLSIFFIRLSGLVLFKLTGVYELVAGPQFLWVMKIWVVLVAVYFLIAYRQFFKITVIQSFVTLVLFGTGTWLSVLAMAEIDRRAFKQSPNAAVGIYMRIPQEDLDRYNGNLNYAYQSVLFVDSVYANTPADLAGILKGDTLLKVNGKKTHRNIFRDQINNHELGETVLLEIQRDGRVMHVPLTLVSADSLPD